MFGDQLLLALKKIPGHGRSLRHLAALQENIDTIIYQDGHICPVNGQQGYALACTHDGLHFAIALDSDNHALIVARGPVMLSAAKQLRVIFVVCLSCFAALSMTGATDSREEAVGSDD
jgi:hypothetical protein